MTFQGSIEEWEAWLDWRFDAEPQLVASGVDPEAIMDGMRISAMIILVETLLRISPEYAGIRLKITCSKEIRVAELTKGKLNGTTRAEQEILFYNAADRYTPGQPAVAGWNPPLSGATAAQRKSFIENGQRAIHFLMIAADPVYLAAFNQKVLESESILAGHIKVALSHYDKIRDTLPSVPRSAFL